MKHSIKSKLFLIFILILALNVLLTFFMGTALFEWLYTVNRTSELKKGAEQIRSAYRAGSDYQTPITELENKNATVGIFRLEDEELEFIYYSRPFRRANAGSTLRFNLNKLGPDAPFPFRDFLTPALFERVKNSGGYNVINRGPAGNGNSIVLLGYVNENTYILAETPTAYIKNTAQLATRYVLYISAFTLLLGVIIIYYTVDRISKPIRKIQTVANKIAAMDFSDRCEITSSDEIAMLAENINHMADELQENIGRIIEANQVLQEDLKRQEETDKMRKQFIANVSHDFKTPLTLIVSYAEALRDLTDVEGTTREDYCNIVIDEGNKMSEMVQMLLKLSQLESGMLKVEKTIFSINEILGDILKNHKLLIAKKQLTAERRTDDDFIVNADYQKIHQVITNLFENALKYSPQGSRIRVSTAQSGDKCCVTVFNSGTRIDEDELENIFISFYRTDRSRTRDMQSYGLGLAIVKAIMDMHGQKYGVRNTKDGVEFWFELDIVELEDDM